MLTFNKFIKFFFIFINLILTLFLFYSFEANEIYIALFSFLINFYFYKSFNKSILSIHFFLSFFFWVGFWLKICFLNLENTFSLNLFKMIGKFNYDFFNPNNLGYVEESLIVAIIGISGFILSLFLNKFFYTSKNYKKFNKNFVSLNTIYKSKKKTILSLFIISFAIVGIVNFNFSIYQRGIVADQNINLIVSSTFKWLLLFGLTSFSAIFIYHSYNKGKISYKVLCLAILENLISSISMLSRGMFVNSMALIFGLFKHHTSNNLKILNKKFIFFILLTIVLFFISIFVVKDLRDAKYLNSPIHLKGSELINDDTEHMSKFNRTINEIFIVVSNRFVGLEQVFYVARKSDDLNFKLFVDSFYEIPDINKLTFFDDKIMNNELDETQTLTNNNTYFINVPGIIGYLYYSGSYVFLFISTLMIGLILSFFERLILTFFHQNYFLSAIISQVLAYRLNNFGYNPSNTYLILITIILNLSIIYLIYAFSGKFSRK